MFIICIRVAYLNTKNEYALANEIPTKIVELASSDGMTIAFIGVTQFCYVTARTSYSDSICTQFSAFDSLA